MVEIAADVRYRIGRAISAIQARLPVVETYIFGSQISGTYTRWSDVDIALFIREFGDYTFTDELESNREGHKAGGYDLEFHFFDASDPANDDPASFAAEVKRTGVRIA